MNDREQLARMIEDFGFDEVLVHLSAIAENIGHECKSDTAAHILEQIADSLDNLSHEYREAVSEEERS